MIFILHKLRIKKKRDLLLFHILALQFTINKYLEITIHIYFLINNRSDDMKQKTKTIHVF